MGNQPWYDSDNPTRVVRGATWRAIVWVVAVIVAVGVIGTGVWAVKVAVSGTKGAGDAARIRNDGTNQVLAQQEFEQRYQDIVAADKRIQVAHDQLRTAPKDQVLQTRYTGAVQYCQTAVAEYNAAARTYTKEQFRDAQLPDQIDDTDPATDCKENAR